MTWTTTKFGSVTTLRCKGIMASDAGQCAVIKGRANETADAKAKRAARTIAEPILDEGWSLEYSVHKLTPATMEDARVCFQNGTDISAPALARVYVTGHLSLSVYVLVSASRTVRMYVS